HIVGGENHGPDPLDYLSLFTLTQDSILAANPNATAILGGLASGGGEPASLTDPANPQRKLEAVEPPLFLAKFLSAGGRARAIAVHPYSLLPPGRSAPGQIVSQFPGIVLDSVWSILQTRGLNSSRLWITEWGV